MVKSSLQLPKRPMRDATHTSLLQRTYYKQIQGLFNKFKENLQPTMTRLFERSETSENYAIQPGITRAFNDRVSAVARGSILIGIPQVARKNITQAYSRGKKTASANSRIRNNSIIIPYELNYLDQRVVDDLIVNNVNYVTKLTEEMKSELLRTLTEGIREQHSTQEIIRDINDRIPEITRSRAKTIARTEISNSYNNAVARSYQSVGIERWQWLAALGYACCPECIARHGRVYEWSDEHPPLHPNCLCTIYPIVDEPFGEMPELEPAEIEPRPELRPHAPTVGPEYEPELVTSVEDKFKENLYDFEETIRKNTYETGRIVDKNGDVLATVTQYDPKQVDWSEQLPIFEKHRAEGDLSVTHNHPMHKIAGGKLISSFSPDDIYFTASKNLKRIRIVGYEQRPGHIPEHNLEYTMERGVEGWLSPGAIRELVRQEHRAVARDLQKAVDEGGMSSFDYSARFHDELWTRITERYPNRFKYSKERL